MGCPWLCEQPSRYLQTHLGSLGLIKPQAIPKTIIHVYNSARATLASQKLSQRV